MNVHVQAHVQMLEETICRIMSPSNTCDCVLVRLRTCGPLRSFTSYRLRLLLYLLLLLRL